MRFFKQRLKEYVQTKTAKGFWTSQTYPPIPDALSATSYTVENVIFATMQDNVHHISYNSFRKLSTTVNALVAKT
jgi:hypothetical protein